MSDKLKPQAKAVLRVLKRRSLTPAQARDMIGTDRLAARVCEIRDKYGHTCIETRRELNDNGSRHARYFWRGEAA